MGWDKFRETLERFFVKDSPINPVQILAQLLFIHTFGGFDYSEFIFIGALISTVVFRQNYFWYVGIIINPNLGYLMPINMLFSMLSCNEEWKTLLCLYIWGDLLLLPYAEFNQFYNVLAVGGLLYQNYYSLSFRNIRENVLFFTCFSLIWTIQMMRFINSRLSLDDVQLWYMIVLVIPLVLFVSGYTIRRQISRILNGNLQQLGDPWHVVHFIENIEKKMKDSIGRTGVQKSHKNECRDEMCKCCTRAGNFEKLYLRQLYYRGFKKFQSTEYDDNLQEFYVTHLLKEGKFPMAVEAALSRKAKRYSVYKKMRQLRVKYLLQDELTIVEQQYPIKSILKDPFSYEQSYQTLKRSLLELLETKINYWIEASKKSVKMCVLRKLGSQFLTKLNLMHQYYLDNVQGMERQIRSFSGSIIYNLFLITATNYKELAEANIKQLKKMADTSVAGSDQNSHYKYYALKASLCDQKLGIIENINSSFCQLLDANLNKSELIGKTADILIPKPYVQKHNQGMRELKRLGKSKLMGQQISPLFILTSTQYLIPCIFILRYSSDIQNEFSMIATIKHIKNQFEYALLDGHGRFCYATAGLINTEMLELEQVKELVTTVQSKWKGVSSEHPLYATPDRVKAQVKFNDNTFTVEVFCMLAASFRYPNPPPMIISIHNQTQTYFVDEEIADDMNAGCLKKLNVVMDQVETESQASSINQRNQIISILSKFENSSNFRVFTVLYFAVFLAFLISLGSLLVQYCAVNLLWTNHNYKINNHKLLLETLYKLQLSSSRIISKSLSIYGIDSNMITESEFGNIYGSNAYLADARTSLKSTCNELKHLVSEDLAAYNLLIFDRYQQALNKQLPVMTHNSSHQEYFSTILRKFVSDCYLLSGPGIKLMDTLVSSQIFWQTIFPHVFVLIDLIKNYHFEVIQKEDTLNYILGATLLVLTMLGLVPIYLSNKRIQEKEDYIFELIVSLEPELLHKEINDLVELQSSLKCKLTPAFDIEDEKVTLQNNDINGDDIRSEHRGLMDLGRRKRNVELNKKGYKRPRAFFYSCAVLFLSFITGIFVIKNQEIAWLSENLHDKVIDSEWRNERLNLVLNVKKQAFKFQYGRLVNGKPLSNWLLTTIQQRKKNYLAKDSLANYTFNCSVLNPMCRSSSLSSELSINIFGQTLISESIEDNLATRLPFLEQLEETGYKIYLGMAPEQARIYENTISNYDSLGQLIFVAGLSTMGVMGVLAIFYLRRVKEAFLRCTRNISFLNEDMIKKNKRVESFLQKLVKIQ